MLPDRVSNPGPLTYESGALSIALRGPAFSVCNKAFMICLREYSFTEIAKTGLISYFVFPAERFTHVRASFLPRYSFCVTWRTVVFKFLRSRISRRQFFYKKQNLEH